MVSHAPRGPRGSLVHVLQRYPLTFWALAAAMIANGVIADALNNVEKVPLLSLFMPAIFIITTLCQIATCVLVTVILVKSKRWELQPLVVLFLATSLLDLAVFLTIRLPVRERSLIVPGNTATSWLFVLIHVAISICAVAYAAARSLKSPMTEAQTRRAIRLWFPAWTVLIIALITVIIASSGQQLPHAGGERTAGVERLIVFGGEFLVSAVALVMFIRYVERATPNWIDLSIALSMIAGLTGLAINVRPVPRYTAAWLDAELLYLFSGTFVLIAAIHDLVERLGDSLRTESQALRVRVTAAEQNAEIEAALLKSRFVAMVSHELRTPLGGIVGMAELLERGQLADDQMQYTKAIKASANSLHRIVTDLLDFSRAESGRIELEDEPFNLEQAVDDILVLFRPQARERGIALSAYVDPVLPRSIRGDQTRLKQVLQNLVSNAIRFTTAGTIRIEVLSGADTGDDELIRFYVSDTGIGIGSHAIDRIFEAFVQEDASTARRFGGTGLGLAIVKHLVELMGGRIEVWSTVDVGTTFMFTLPTRIARGDPAERRSLRDTAILVFDEEPESLSLLMRFVDGWNMQSAGAATAEAARAAVAERAKSAARFDVLLVGSGVSDTTAESLLRDVRADAIAAPASAIIIRDRSEGEAARIAAEFDRCITGPVRQSPLFDAIVRLRRNVFAASVVPAIQGVAARGRREERVLVAEDNEINQTLLVAQLEHLGFQADVVTDGEAAVDAASRGAYDLIFMDCQMPHLDGFEATRLIRASAARDTPIVALTAHVLPGYRETCLAAGMNDYLAKPALIGPLSEMVDRWLPAPVVAAAGETPAQPSGTGSADALAHMRERLLEVFHGDIARTDRVIATSLTALNEGAALLEVALAEHDIGTATSTAHRLKGIALEIGGVELADYARDLERCVQDRDWAHAEEALRAFHAGVDAATALSVQS